MTDLVLRKDAVNVDHIHTFWKECEAEGTGRRVMPSLNFLHNTGRMDDETFQKKLANHKPVDIASMIQEANKARHADGDFTLSTQLRGERATHTDR